MAKYLPFKVITDNREFKTPDEVGRFTTMLEAKAFSHKRKEETGREYAILCDGIRYWSTEENDVRNIFAL